MEGLAERIRSRREALGMSQDKLADAIEGSDVQISHYECGRRVPSVARLRDLAKALRCTSDWLLGLRDKP